MPDQPTPPADPAARIAELEAKLAEVTAERDWLAENRKLLKSIACAPPADLGAIPPVTEEELHDAMHGPRGRSLIEIIEEHERKLEGS